MNRNTDLVFVLAYIRNFIHRHFAVIQVNAIGPNITYTPMMVGLLPPDEETRNKIADGLPARRIGYEIDVVGVALFLASAASDMVTATTIYPDGGLVATS